MNNESIVSEKSHIRKVLERAIKLSEDALFLDTGNTPEEEAKGYPQWRWAVYWNRYSMLNDSIDEFCERIENEERESNIRIAPTSPFLIILEVKQGQLPTNFWSKTLWQTSYGGFNDPRLRDNSL